MKTINEAASLMGKKSAAVQKARYKNYSEEMGRRGKLGGKGKHKKPKVDNSNEGLK